jgi:putative phosphoesterase
VVEQLARGHDRVDVVGRHPAQVHAHQPAPYTRRVRVVVLSDTHVREGSRRRLPPLAVAQLETADVILHCGDVVSTGLLDELRAHAPVHAVLGNNDDAELQATLPETLALDLDGVAVAMIHDSGPRPGRPARLARRFPDASVVVFGHSHIPVDEPGADGQWLVNPGSATQRRRQPHHTVGVLELADGALRAHRIVVVDG